MLYYCNIYHRYILPWVNFVSSTISLFYTHIKINCSSLVSLKVENGLVDLKNLFLLRNF